MSLAAWVQTITILLQSLGWHIVFLTLTLVFRRQLKTLIIAIAGRITKGGWRAGLGTETYIGFDHYEPFPPVQEEGSNDSNDS